MNAIGTGTYQIDLSAKAVTDNFGPIIGPLSNGHLEVEQRCLPRMATPYEGSFREPLLACFGPNKGPELLANGLCLYRADLPLNPKGQ